MLKKAHCQKWLTNICFLLIRPRLFKIFCFSTYFLTNLTEMYGILHGIDDPFWGRQSIENTSWKVRAYGIYALVVDVSERFLIQNNECVNTRTKQFLFGLVFIIYILRQSPFWDLFIVSLSKMPKLAATHREMTTTSKYQPLSEMFVKNITRVRIWGNPRITSNLNNRLLRIHNWKWMNLGKMAGLNIK